MSVRDFVPHWDTALLFAGVLAQQRRGRPVCQRVVSPPFWRAHRRDARRRVWTRGTANVRDDESGPVRGTVGTVAGQRRMGPGPVFVGTDCYAPLPTLRRGHGQHGVWRMNQEIETTCKTGYANVGGDEWPTFLES